MIERVEDGGYVDDVAGGPVRPGDRIAVAFRNSYAAELRVGRVEGLYIQHLDWGPPKVLVGVEWEASSTRWNSVKFSKIEAEHRRFVKIEESK